MKIEHRDTPPLTTEFESSEKKKWPKFERITSVKSTSRTFEQYTRSHLSLLSRYKTYDSTTKQQDKIAHTRLSDGIYA
jgi:hypothetical protein